MLLAIEEYTHLVAVENELQRVAFGEPRAQIGKTLCANRNFDGGNEKTAEPPKPGVQPSAMS